MLNEGQEVWKTYPDYPWIEASNLGKIRTKDRWVLGKNGSKRLIKGHILKQWLSNSGYMFVHFRVNGKMINLFVHKIIAILFVPNYNNYPEVNHIDCDPTNNRWDNLEWCTHQENIAYRDKLGHTAKHKNKMKPVIAINSETSEILYFESQMEAERQLGVRHGNIWSVIKGKRNTAGGLWFCYADENAVEKTRAKFGNEVVEKVEKLMNEHRN